MMHSIVALERLIPGLFFLSRQRWSVLLAKKSSILYYCATYCSFHVVGVTHAVTRCLFGIEKEPIREVVRVEAFLFSRLQLVVFQ